MNKRAEIVKDERLLEIFSGAILETEATARQLSLMAKRSNTCRHQ